MNSAAIFLAAVDLGNSSQIQSGLQPSGPQAGLIANLWWLFFWVSVGVYTLTLAFLLCSIWRAKPSSNQIHEGVTVPQRSTEGALRVVVSAAVALTVGIL